MEKVDEILHPVEVGETYLVPCVETTEIITEAIYIDPASEDRAFWMDFSHDEQIRPQVKRRVPLRIPVINHPHSDRENGQDEIHYHLDTRFVKWRWHSKYDLRIPDKQELVYVPLEVIADGEQLPTAPSMIANSRMPHRRLKNHKCPHRGYDMRKVKPVNGCLTCPLHGLKFDAETHECLNMPTKDAE